MDSELCEGLGVEEEVGWRGCEVFINSLNRRTITSVLEWNLLLCDMYSIHVPHRWALYRNHIPSSVLSAQDRP